MREDLPSTEKRASPRRRGDGDADDHLPRSTFDLFAVVEAIVDGRAGAPGPGAGKMGSQVASFFRMFTRGGDPGLVTTKGLAGARRLSDYRGPYLSMALCHFHFEAN
jgi:hypothetical protein